MNHHDFYSVIAAVVMFITATIVINLSGRIEELEASADRLNKIAQRHCSSTIAVMTPQGYAATVCAGP